MEVGRNDLCPCGSGKKYKKCCMKKEQVVELGKVKLEQFFQIKHQLVERMGREVFPSFSFQEFQSLKREFERRVKVKVPEGFFDHWLLFFHRNKNGLRGIEWYNQNAGKREEPALKEIASGWEKLMPRLIQQVDYDDHGVIVEDLFTHERFHMPYCETMQRWIPWAGTFCFLEENNGSFYMNGVAAFNGPDGLKRAFDLLTQYMEETESSYEEAAMELYLEILRSLLFEPNVEETTQEVLHTELHFDVQNMAGVAEQCIKDPRFQMEEWDGNSGRGSFIKKKFRYEDNAAPGPVHLAEVEGTIEVNKGKLIYTSLHSEGVVSFKRLMMTVTGIKLVDEKSETLHAPVNIQATVYSVHLSEGVPKDFAMIAQQGLLAAETDQPLPLFDGLTSEEMAAAGRVEELEQSLREQEYASYHAIRHGSGEVKLTADFNSVRRKLGLKLSPFVTLGEARESTISNMTKISDNMSSLTGDDMSIIEEIGMPEVEAENFYVKDMVEFFREKAVGKSQNTYYKYRLGLQTIKFYFSKVAVSSWLDVNKEHWAELIAYNYLAFNMDATVNQAKGFFTVVKSFAAKIDQTYGTAHAADVRLLVKELDPSILAAVHVLEAYVPYHERRYELGYSHSRMHEMIRSQITKGQIVEGIFEVIDRSEAGVHVQALGEGGKPFNVTMNQIALSAIEPGMLIVGSILKDNEWEFLNVIRVFPARAARFIEVAELV